MKPEAKKFLIGIYQSIEKLELYRSTLHSFQRLNDNLLAKDAIERRLAIIGEALNKAIKIDNSISVTNSRRIISLRNILVHDYDLIDTAYYMENIRKGFTHFKNRNSNYS